MKTDLDSYWFSWGRDGNGRRIEEAFGHRRLPSKVEFSGRYTRSGRVFEVKPTELVVQVPDMQSLVAPAFET
jgi:hypothetical protein